jgi:YVTN family beta-propeller protein
MIICQTNSVICFLSLSVLLLFLYTVIFFGNGKALEKPTTVINSTTLESIASPVGYYKGVAQINTGESPSIIYDDPKSDSLFVMNSGSDTVSIINTTANVLVHNIEVGNYPVFMYSLSNLLYVANAGSDTVSIINTSSKSLIGDIAVGDSPSSIYSESGKIYVGDHDSNTVTVINATTNTVLQQIPIEGGPNYIYGDKDYPDTIYVASSGGISSGTVSIIDTQTYNVTKTIPVGSFPTYIYSIPSNGTYSDLLFVANYYSDSISLINTTLKDVIREVEVQHNPDFIYGDELTSEIYVANAGSDTVTVYDYYYDKITANITVGNNPIYIYAPNTLSNLLYVANAGSDTVSIINSSAKEVIHTISVGKNPTYIQQDLPLEYDRFAYHPEPNYPEAMYVSNHGSGGLSIINLHTDKVVAGVIFNTSPTGTGNILCDTGSEKLEAPTSRYIYVNSGTECTANPSKGFEFSKWIENLEGNSTRTIATSSGSPLTGFLDTLNIKLNDPAATLPINQFGNISAYFKPLPAPLPTGYWASLFTVIITALIGSLLIPAVVEWIRATKQTSRLNSFHQQMGRVYADDVLDMNDTKRLNILFTDITDSYSAGKINNEQYTNLRNEVSRAFQKVFNERIKSISVQNTKELEEVKNNITDAYADGKLTKLHYDLLHENYRRLQKNEEKGQQSSL